MFKGVGGVAIAKNLSAKLGGRMLFEGVRHDKFAFISGVLGVKSRR
jgi:hypothetical protein